MAQSRPLIMPWLRQQIDSGRFPGLDWTNEEQTEFSIPWKHALRTDSSSHDVLIFKAWAEVSGNGVARGDASVWKRNFRSALRAKYFTVVGDNKNDNANPNKLYRWPSEPNTNPTPPRSAEAPSSSGSQDQEEDITFPTQESQVVPGVEDFIHLDEESLFTGDQHRFCPTESTIDHDILQECLMGLNIEPPTECVPNSEPQQKPEQQYQPLQAGIGRHALPEQQYQPLQAGIGGHALPEQQYQPLQAGIGGHALPEQQYQPLQAGIGGHALPEQQYQPLQSGIGGHALPEQQYQLLQAGIGGHALPEQQYQPLQSGIGGHALPEQQYQPLQAGIGGHALPEQQYQPMQDVIGGQQYPVAFVDAAGRGVLPEQPVYPMEGAVGGACDQQRVEEFINTMSMAMEGDRLRTQFQVSVYYRGTKVSEQLVQNENGLRLVYRPVLAGPVTDPPSGLTLVSLPSPGLMVRDQKQAILTQSILDNLGEGLDVGVSGNVVYGQRHGDTKVFWSFQKFEQSTDRQEVSKLQPQPLYLFKDFLQGMMEFINGKKTCPPCSLLFFLGEKWPDTMPWEKKLIMVEVVLTTLDVLKSMAVDGGASSLQSVDLQLSLQECMDMCTE